jgi:enoyl-CoA hydratase
MLNVPTAPAEKSHADGKILQSVVDGVGTVTFNNADKRNAMSLEMWEGFGRALAELRDDPAVRVVVLTGAGDKAFVSGADISQFEKERHNAQASEEYSRRSSASRALLADYPKPIIARINGFCIGGGLQVAMAADIRIAAEGSQFGIPAAKLGIAYGFDGLKHLVSLVGPSWARLLMFTGMRIDASEALRIGLVDRSCRRASWPTPSRKSQPPSPATRRSPSMPPSSPSPKSSRIPRIATWTPSRKSAPGAWTARIFAKAAAPSWTSARRSSTADSDDRREQHG